MWAKILSWVALVCNALAVAFNVGMVSFAMAYRPKGASMAAEIVGVVVLGAFVLSGPIVTIFALLFDAPLVRRGKAALAASALD